MGLLFGVFHIIVFFLSFPQVEMSQKSPISHYFVDIFQISVYAGTRAISEKSSVFGNPKKIYLVVEFSRVPAFFYFLG